MVGVMTPVADADQWMKTLDQVRDEFCDCPGHGLGDAEHSPDGCLGLRVKMAALAAQKQALWSAAATMELSISRVALEQSLPDCHAKRCAQNHPTVDEFTGIVAGRFRDELRTRSILLGDPGDADLL